LRPAILLLLWGKFTLLLSSSYFGK
jgi:hypothetical protein